MVEIIFDLFYVLMLRVRTTVFLILCVVYLTLIDSESLQNVIYIINKQTILALWANYHLGGMIEALVQLVF